MGLRVCPVFRDLPPIGAKARFVDVAILNDERTQSIGVRQNDAESDRRAVVVKVQRIVRDLQLLEKVIDRLGKMIERIGIFRRQRRVAQTEVGIVRSDQMLFCREQGNERVKLARRRRESHVRARWLGRSQDRPPGRKSRHRQPARDDRSLRCWSKGEARLVPCLQKEPWQERMSIGGSPRCSTRLYRAHQPSSGSIDLLVPR